ncbi:histone acetyltransferase KAT7 [Contarinia nasturtii]|uniref:histone acetyltransferase KAT7 n=1 Tax=Contarinia nasturtii TaxID=265458 RepID=UPI0012D3BDC0|nr:histone acetyltransferase KAT7 [Contarinia nasturtii]
MSSRKKSVSTSGTSCSSSGTTSSSGSTSDSDSNSSSSDSESSSSQGGNRSSASNSTPNESKSSQATPAKKENPKENANAKMENEKTPPNATNNKTKGAGATSKGSHAQQQHQQQKTNSRKVTAYSSEDETPQTKAEQAEAKRIQNEIKKKTVASQALKSKIAPLPPPTGGKAPPSVVKQHQQMNKAAANRNNNANKSNTKSPANSKKKSIFSPDNSSESEGETPTKKNASPTKKTPAPRGRPPKNKPPEKPPPPPKSSESSSASSTDSSSSRDSESESSAQSSPPVKKKPTVGRKPGKKQSRNSASASTSKSDQHGNSESDVDMKPVTRSSNTRKSKHLTAIFNPSKASEPSESETDVKHTKSPVKRTKGKANNSKINSKLNANVPKKTVSVVEERKCPVDGCDSIGHLNGKFEKHFTQEACPFYHNVLLDETKKRREERLKHEDERKKATILFDPMSNVTTVEQKAYQMKINDMRANFVPNPPSPVRQPNQNAIANKHHQQQQNGETKQKEPTLKGYVTDYDLRLFQEAQAVASEKIETDLLRWPADNKGTKYITMGRHNMVVWYQSPYPDDAARLPKLYLCEFCLRYQKSEITMKRHAAKCVWRHPPGDEIYRKGKLGVWQVDGKRQKQYCQHLCLLAKFFLDHKTLYYDVEPFLFYVMTLADSEGCHTIGYFSKEKNSFLNYNVSCILTLPPYQRKGYGRLLIDFSYLLTRVEGKIGSPEKPLSDLGLISYRSYWKDVLLDYLCSRSGSTLSIKDVSQEMAINSYDIVSTLQALGMMKYWKGKHIILKKQDVLEEYAERVKRRGAVVKIDPAHLRWTPFVPPAPATSS